MKPYALYLAKQRLRIPELWKMLGLPGRPGKSCHCPFRKDSKPSFSVYDEGRRWRDFGKGEGGDAVSFLAKARDLEIGDAIREFKALAGVTESVTTTNSGFNRARKPMNGGRHV